MLPASKVTGVTPGTNGRVRPVEPRDLPQIAGLYTRVFGHRQESYPGGFASYLARIFIEHPWREGRLPSLVFENNAGSVTGCIGVMPRPMWFDGRKIVAAISHSFMVEPGTRSRLAA